MISLKYSDLTLCLICFQVDLQPSDRFKSLILAGQSPEIILEITARAINFYELQQSLRSQFLEYVAAKSMEKTKSIEKELKNLMLKMKEENSVYEHMKKAVCFNNAYLKYLVDSRM